MAFPAKRKGVVPKQQPEAEQPYHVTAYAQEHNKIPRGPRGAARVDIVQKHKNGGKRRADADEYQTSPARVLIGFRGQCANYRIDEKTGEPIETVKKLRSVHIMKANVEDEA